MSYLLSQMAQCPGMLVQLPPRCTQCNRIPAFLFFFKNMRGQPQISSLSLCGVGVDLGLDSLTMSGLVPDKFTSKHTLPGCAASWRACTVSPWVLKTITSRYFLVPKRDGNYRPILDLRVLNKAVMPLRFRMLTPRRLVQFIRPNDWFITIDLKDAYFHVPIHHRHRRYLRFAFGGIAYQFNALPFGLSLAPRVFTKCVE